MILLTPHCPALKKGLEKRSNKYFGQVSDHILINYGLKKCSELFIQWFVLFQRLGSVYDSLSSCKQEQDTERSTPILHHK
jgi:hypothetical protein